MKLVVNGADVEVDDRHAKTPSLWVLRDVLGLHGTKFGCGAGFCAACTVLIDGRNTKSCHDSFGREHSWGRLHYCVREEQSSAAVVAAVAERSSASVPAGWSSVTKGVVGCEHARS